MVRVTLCAIAIATVAVIVGCGGQTNESVSPAIEKLDMPGIVNFSRVRGLTGFAGSPVGFGGATKPVAMPALKSAGFAAVINLRLATEEGTDLDGSRAAAAAAGLNYVHLPFDGKNLDTALVGEFLSAASDTANQPVYIHCHSATRVAALWMIGRVLEDGLDIGAAAQEAEVIAAKPEAAVAVATGYISSRMK